MTMFHLHRHHPITITHQHHHHLITAGHLNGPHIPETAATPPLGSRARLPLSSSAVAGCLRHCTSSAARPAPLNRTEWAQPLCQLASGCHLAEPWLLLLAEVPFATQRHATSARPCPPWRPCLAQPQAQERCASSRAAHAQPPARPGASSRGFATPLPPRYPCCAPPAASSMPVPLLQQLIGPLLLATHNNYLCVALRNLVLQQRHLPL